jgi:hypothetical protein
MGKSNRKHKNTIENKRKKGKNSDKIFKRERKSSYNDAG